MAYIEEHITQYVEQDGSGYTVRVELLQPRDGDDNPLPRAGYHEPTPLYHVFTDGQVYCDHDPHRLVTEADIDSWLIDRLEMIADRLTPDPDTGPRGVLQIIRDVREAGKTDYASREEVIDEGVSEGYSESEIEVRLRNYYTSGDIYHFDEEKTQIRDT